MPRLIPNCPFKSEIIVRLIPELCVHYLCISSSCTWVKNRISGTHGGAFLASELRTACSVSSGSPLCWLPQRNTPEGTQKVCRVQCVPTLELSRGWWIKRPHVGFDHPISFNVIQHLSHLFFARFFSRQILPRIGFWSRHPSRHIEHELSRNRFFKSPKDTVDILGACWLLAFLKMKTCWTPGPTC